MSQDANQLNHRRFFEEVVNQNRLPLIEELFVPHYASHGLPPHFPTGRPGLRALVCAFRAALPDASVSVDCQSSDGDRTSTRITFRGAQMAQFNGITPLGQRIMIHTVDTARFENGLIVEQWGGLDIFDLSQQLVQMRPPARSGQPIASLNSRV